MESKRTPYHKRLGLRRYVLSVTPEMYERIKQASFADGRSMQKWIVRTLARALKMDIESEMKRL